MSADRPAEASTGTFSDGATYRVEISSVEGPDVLEAVINEAVQRNVRVHRVSQGSGVDQLTDEEIHRMVHLGRQTDIEICLWVGERSGWGIGAQARTDAGRAAGASVRGRAGIDRALRETERAVSLGVRSVLLADLGVIAAVAQARQTGELPGDLLIKSSVAIPVTNPGAASVLESLGVDSLNVATDLTVTELAEIRSTTTVPLDVYVEGPDDYGGVVRHAEAPEIVAAAAPVYLKFAVRNAPPLYPTGTHLQATAALLGRERVRRAQLTMQHLRSGADTPARVDAP